MLSALFVPTVRTTSTESFRVCAKGIKARGATSKTSAPRAVHEANSALRPRVCNVYSVLFLAGSTKRDPWCSEGWVYLLHEDRSVYETATYRKRKREKVPQAGSRSLSLREKLALKQQVGGPDILSSAEQDKVLQALSSAAPLRRVFHLSHGARKHEQVPFRIGLVSQVHREDEPLFLWSGN